MYKRQEYNYEDYDMYGLENNTINQWYLPEEIDIESSEYKRISFDVKEDVYKRQVGGEGVIARESPDEDALNQCRELGEALAAAEA